MLGSVLKTCGDACIEIAEYFNKALETIKPMYPFIVGIAMSLLFPDEAYVKAASAVGITMIIDILTKYYSIGKTSGLGIWGAIKQGKIRSSRLWEGTYKKLISYFVVMILAGLSVRVIPITQIAVFSSTLVYAVMWLREAQSSIENLIDAGHDLEWLLFWLKKKEKEVMRNEGIEIKEDKDNGQD